MSMHKRQQGFSLLELLMVVALMSIVVVGILSQVDLASQRSYTEQVKVDDLQETRDFIDQFFRDINEIGYPNTRMVDLSSASWSPGLYTQNSITPVTAYTWASTYIPDPRFAVGLVKIAPTELRFEADTNGDGNVQSIVYMINGNGNCAKCLQRSQVAKVAADPLTGQTPNWGTEVNDVQNSVIFTYFKSDGTQVNPTTWPIDYTTQANAQILASIKTIQIALQVRNPTLLDLKTLEPIETNISGEVSINNCSMVYSGQTTSCQ